MRRAQSQTNKTQFVAPITLCTMVAVTKLSLIGDKSMG
jgi:hypothetical protein